MLFALQKILQKGTGTIPMSCYKEKIVPLRSLKVCQGEDDKSYSSRVFLNLNPKLCRAGIVVECIFFMKGHTVRMDGVVREGFFFWITVYISL